MSADAYRKKFADFLLTQPMGQGVSHEDVMRATTREELGISSLNIILVVVNYIKEHKNDQVPIKPEWVSRLSDIDGIASVLREIDETDLAQAPA
ncbi:hypothetical protein Q5762_01560 [Streptomyces sp. P9(2023)]|uniref:hypothetical protein n=1 Tax=Streptomyces sp. P9(2023) TaxID=3064394 RepID=UPI0028F3EA8F|nr:hypothetical protein [Streptomyces sp. P9(2023)]MDT9687053.1 hypothetical protein [Streptomyces sp. P9(2023)]